MHLPSALLLLLLASPVLAEGEAEDAVRQFGIAMNRLLEGEPADIAEGVTERLIEQGGAPALDALVDALNATLRSEDELRSLRGGSQQRISAALERMQQIEGEIAELQRRDRAGEKDLAPAMARMRRENVRVTEAFDRDRGELARLDERIATLQKVRQRLVDAAGDVLGRIEGGPAMDAVYEGLAGRLPVKDEVRSLYLVRILARAGRADAVSVLGALLAETDAPGGTRRLALSALAKSGTTRALEVLVAAWEGDAEEWGTPIAHVLSLAARRRLASPEEARAWLAERATPSGDPD